MGYMKFAERFEIPRYDDLTKIKMGKVGIDSETCSGCRICAQVCPADALMIENGKSVFKQRGECMGCAACVAICPENAITLLENYRFSGRFKNIGQGALTFPRLYSESSR